MTVVVPVPNLSIDSRGGCGPAWSPDGTRMAAIYEARWRSSGVGGGEPKGPPRHHHRDCARTELGRRFAALYQSNDKLKIIDTEPASPARCRWTDIRRRFEDASVVHVRKRWWRAGMARNDVIVIDGNRITRHPGNRVAGRRPPARIFPRSRRPRLTACRVDRVSPNLQADFGESRGRAFLAFGITTVRSPGNLPYGVEDRGERRHPAGARVF